MNAPASLFSRLRQRLLSISIFTRIAIGNSLIIVLGAVGGTLITRHLTGEAADAWLIFFFALVGVTTSVLVNFFIVKAALDPLHQLRRFVDHLQSGKASISQLALKNPDPDIHQLATALSSLILKLEDTNNQLRRLSEQVINAQEEERKRIARSLHDDTGQALSMLIIDLERLENRIPQEPLELHTRLSKARQLATDTLNELRKTVHGLRPTILDDLGLIPAIRWYARSNLEEAGIQVEVDTPINPSSIPPRLSTTLFRIAQEAINNIVRHSQAQKAVITLSYNNGKICLQIEDDGRGFDTTQSPKEAMRMQHWGLIGIQERAELVGGTFKISSEPDHGTHLEVTVPLQVTGVVADE